MDSLDSPLGKAVHGSSDLRIVVRPILPFGMAIGLLALAVEAARARATVGEISDALEKVYGRHRAVIQSISGVYGSAYAGDAEFAAIQASVQVFARDEGRRPRMLVVKLGQDGHDRGAKVIATAFADLGGGQVTRDRGLHGLSDGLDSQCQQSDCHTERENGSHYNP